MKRRALRLGRFVITTTNQAQGAPIVDRAAVFEDGRRFDGIAIHLSPWRRTRYGDRAIGRALVLGLERKTAADSTRSRRVTGVGE